MIHAEHAPTQPLGFKPRPRSPQSTKWVVVEVSRPGGAFVVCTLNHVYSSIRNVQDHPHTGRHRTIYNSVVGWSDIRRRVSRRRFQFLI